MKLVLLGAPGAGKGTQSDIISKKLSIPSISTGNILRLAVRNETRVGLKAKAFMESGGLVPDEIVIGIIRERMEEPDCRDGYILDGMPRTIVQAQALEDAGIGVDMALSIEISDEEIISRMSGRRVCPGCGATYHTENIPPKVPEVCDACGEALSVRKDDEPETEKNRLAVYHRESEAVKALYASSGRLKSVDGSGAGIEAATKAIFEALGI